MSEAVITLGRRTFIYVGLASLLLFVGISFGLWEESAFLIYAAAAFATIALLLSIVYERFPMYLLVAVLPLAELLRIGQIPSTLLIIPGALAIISLLAALWSRRKQLVFHRPIMIPAALLGTWALISTAYLGRVSESRPYWLVIVLLLLVPNFLTSEDHFRKITWILLISLGTAGFYALAERLLAYQGAESITFEGLHALNFSIGDKNIVGMWLSLGIPFAFYMHEYLKPWPASRFIVWICGLGMLGGALATLSIGVFVGLCVVIAMFLLLQTGLKARFRYAILGVLLLLTALTGPFQERLRRHGWNLDDSWGSYRVSTWKAGFQVMLDNPVFGIGSDQALRLVEMQKYLNVPFLQYWVAKGILIEPHNMLLSVGVELGIPGVLLFLVLFLMTFIALLHARHRLLRRAQGMQRAGFTQYFSNMLLVSLSTGIVQGMGLSEHLNKYIWFLMGCAAAVAVVAAQSTKPDLSRIRTRRI